MPSTFKVLRSDPDSNEKPHFQSYTVETRKGMTVLEGLFYIQEKLDGSVAFRSSCRAGVCGSCGMNINGSFKLACETQIGSLPPTVILQPQTHFTVIKDLVVDLEPFWRKYKDTKPYLLPPDPAPAKERPQSQADREKLDIVSDCILCANCYAACPITGIDPEYRGPQAFLQSARFLRDSRDGERDMRIDIEAGEHGVSRCHSIYACQKACPKDLDPSEQIGRIKRAIVGRVLTRRRY